MINLNRRETFALSSATLLTACNGFDSSEFDIDQSNIIKLARIDDDYGLDSRLEKPPATHILPFQPNKMCVIYIRFKSSGIEMLSARFKFPWSQSNNLDERLDIACKLIEYSKNGTDFKDAAQSVSNTTRKKIDLTKTIPYAKSFKFKQQNDIYIYIEHGGLATLNAVQTQDGYAHTHSAIQFSEFNGVDGTMNDPNGAFFGGKLFIRTAGQALGGQKIQRLWNYHTGIRGDALSVLANDKPTQRYSMNIMTLYGQGAGQFPVIIDPETGNGGGDGDDD